MIQTVEETVGYIIRNHHTGEGVEDLQMGDAPTLKLIKAIEKYSESIGAPITIISINGHTVIRKCIMENVE